MQITIPLFWVSGLESLFLFLFLVFTLMLLIWVYKLIASLLVGG